MRKLRSPVIFPPGHCIGIKTQLVSQSNVIADAGQAQAQRARAGDDQHRNRIHQRRRKLPAYAPPQRESQRADRDHYRNEHARYLVGEALDRRLGALRLAHQANNAGQHGRRAHAFGAAAQQPLLVERARVDLSPAAYASAGSRR